MAIDRFSDLQKQGFMKLGRKRGPSFEYEVWLPGGEGVAQVTTDKASAERTASHYPGSKIVKVKRNPRGTTGKFERCVEAVSARGGAYDPRAVCAAQERREIGQKELTRRAVAGKRRAARGNPKPKTIDGFEYWVHGGDVYRNQVGQRGYMLSEGIPANARWESTVEHWNRYHPDHPLRKRNPADTAAEAYERFHGEPPSQFTEVTERIHYHSNLWSLGKLRSLVIRTVDKESEVKLSRFDGAFLAANEQAFSDLSRTGHARAQLFVKGGDQSVNLEDFGIDPDRAHEVETLGKAIDVAYETNKVHLGDEGGQAVYEHKFRRTREGDAEVKVHWSRYPDVIYRVLDQRIEFSGGSYELIAEGINL